MLTFQSRSKFKRTKSVLASGILLLASLFSILILLTLLLQILNNNFGYVKTKNTRSVPELKEIPLNDVKKETLVSILQERVRPTLRRNLEPLAEKDIKTLQDLVRDHVLKEKIIQSWTLFQSLTQKKEIFSSIQDSSESIRFHYWFSPTFVLKEQRADAGDTGIRTAILGSIWIIFFAALFSIPFGIATAIYLEEYAKKNALNTLITTNIYNLAGVPSIIYGLLGLALFVRLLEPLTQGRTIFSASLTLALMCLPLIIINSQEAIRAVPNTLRNSSYALGATKWETIFYHVLPYSMERIITGIILAISRAVGETAPLVVIGAATFISTEPDGLYSGFTALPIQIYQWASRPQQIFYNTSSAAIIALLLLILLINIIPISVRNTLLKRDKL